MRKVVAASLLAFCLAGILASRLLSGKSADNTALGKPVADFSLKDTKGQDVALSSFKDKKAVVVLFLGTECPINNAYLPRLAELHKEYESKACSSSALTPTSRMMPRASPNTPGNTRSPSPF